MSKYPKRSDYLPFVVRKRLRRAAHLVRRVYSDGIVWKANRAKCKVLLTSIPKAGTHLLLAVLEEYSLGRPVSLGDGRAVDEYGRRVPLTVEFLSKKDALMRPGDIMWGHVTPTPERVRFFEERGYAIFLMVRDPRDVVCSRISQAVNSERDHYHELLAGLATREERINHVIRHYTSFDAPSVASDFAEYRRWEEVGDITTMRYERLVGPEGGGSAEVQLREMMKIEDGFGLVGVSRFYRRFIARRLYNQEGRIGRHKEQFTEANFKLFNESCEHDLLAWALGD